MPGIFENFFHIVCLIKFIALSILSQFLPQCSQHFCLSRSFLKSDVSIFHLFNYMCVPSCGNVHGSEDAFRDQGGQSDALELE